MSGFPISIDSIHYSVVYNLKIRTLINQITIYNLKTIIMSKVTVIGAGNVGATCANVLAFKEVADEVIMLDVRVYRRVRLSI